MSEKNLLATWIMSSVVRSLQPVGRGRVADELQFHFVSFAGDARDWLTGSRKISDPEYRA